MQNLSDTQEERRLQEAREHQIPWGKWGPYLSERQWGTVREDYSASGDAWDYFTHDQARSRAYRWGEDGLAGFADDKQRLCLALALWNGRDPILKERLLRIMKDTLAQGEELLISGFGKFTVRQKKARRGRNPQTKESLVLAARKVLVFKASGGLRERINNS